MGGCEGDKWEDVRVVKWEDVRVTSGRCEG